jgi:hypothetical protein
MMLNGVPFCKMIVATAAVTNAVFWDSLFTLMLSHYAWFFPPFIAVSPM